ncbi:2-amino-4-hydroxy-6-hydroxymethyldihydropteridine diphosphokinase [Desulfofundulus thermocisternus]|uniref:2-amino-4-hydroxy-6- hydroxymethyldihydropteridine diphosphokinase n=1 Tax=Desulfofundulus thermocisternus TaxID=42471 RepID=UPI000487EF74|nr:2-amino-4-hydroxy-6-hydroxymethyldihydropteridine diphosphokinase [Desulfofundulus thermocisternus]
MEVVAYIGLGSNMGGKKANLKAALELLGRVPGVKILRVAPFYRTEPVGYTDQDWFVNTVAEVETTLSPRELLAACLEVENRLGRVRGVRWGPRVIDLDLLLYNGQVIDEPDLVVPHPLMHERAFVLVPLADLAPDLVIPGRGGVRELLAGVDRQGVEQLEKSEGQLP